MSAAVIFKKDDNKLKMKKKINVEEDSELYFYLKGHYKDIAASDQILIENEVRLFEGEKLKVTVSIGVAVNQKGKYSPEHLVQQADTALYIAKGAGRDIVKFYRNLE